MPYIALTGFFFDCRMDWAKSCPLTQTWNGLGPTIVAETINFLKDCPVSSVIPTPPICQIHPESYSYIPLYLAMCKYIWQIHLNQITALCRQIVRVATSLGSYEHLVQKLRNCSTSTVRNCFTICLSKLKYVGIHFLFSKYIITRLIYVKIEKTEEEAFLSHGKLF